MITANFVLIVTRENKTKKKTDYAGIVQNIKTSGNTIEDFMLTTVFRLCTSASMF